MRTGAHIFGGHVSIAGGYKEAPARAAAIGGNALQMFSGNPRGWNLPQVAPAEAGVFMEEAKKLVAQSKAHHGDAKAKIDHANAMWKAKSAQAQAEAAQAISTP